mmetsp:Transcript_57154/g.99955  ORF Transcript_57154/g.99955 Transcript_57154/m.99955 type:complete len:230 (-) Transcript_57154:41-730(-)
MAGGADELARDGAANVSRDSAQQSEVSRQLGQAAEGNGSPGEAGPAINAQMAQSLLLSLELLHADYAATLAAENRQPAAREKLQNFSPPDRIPAEADDGESSGPHDDGALAGYAALGSDDEGSPPGSEADAEDTDATVTAEAKVAADCDEDDWADFGPANPALPKPPAPPPQLQTISLTDEQCQLIKETMLGVTPVAPSWAENLSDRELHRMVQRELARESKALSPAPS